MNKAVVNEDPNARIIRELREEVEKLQMQLKESEVCSELLRNTKEIFTVFCRSPPCSHLDLHSHRTKSLNCFLVAAKADHSAQVTADNFVKHVFRLGNITKNSSFTNAWLLQNFYCILAIINVCSESPRGCEM